MAETKPQPKKGDPCPVCGDEFVDVRAATPEERAKASDRENPINLGKYVDTASAAVLEELGPLAQCRRCGYKTRYAPETAAEARAADREGKGRRSHAAAGSSKE